MVGTTNSILSVTTGTPLVEPVAIPAEVIEVDETDEEVEIVIRGGAGGSGVKAAESGNHTGTPHLKKKHSMNSDRRVTKKQASNCKLTETSLKVIPYAMKTFSCAKTERVKVGLKREKYLHTLTQVLITIYSICFDENQLCLYSSLVIFLRDIRCQPTEPEA